MKILIVATDNIPHIGGKSSHILSLKEGLESNGHSVDMCSYKDIPNFFKKISTIILKIRYFYSKEKYFLNYQKFKIKIFRIYFKFFYKKNPDLIISQDSFAALATKDYYKKVFNILTMHTYIALEPILDNGIIKKNSNSHKLLFDLELKGINLVERVVCVDSRIKEHILKETDHINENVISIMNFVNINEFKSLTNIQKNELRLKKEIKLDEFIILSTRRLVEKNGVIYLLKALKKLENKNAIKLLIVGDGPEKRKLINYCMENNLSTYVKFVGSVENKLIKDYYNISDVVVVPSITVNGLQEATSISAIEAMACEKVVIASNIGGLKEIIKNNETGILISEKNEDEIVKSIENLIKDNNFKRRIEIKAREAIEINHSNLQVAKEFLKIII